MKTEYYSKNIITTINTHATSVSTTITWNLTQLKKTDAKSRNQFTCRRMHQPKADFDRRWIDGSAMIQLELSYRISTMEVYKYLAAIKRWMLYVAKKHKKSF